MVIGDNVSFKMYWCEFVLTKRMCQYIMKNVMDIAKLLKRSDSIQIIIIPRRKPVTAELIFPESFVVSAVILLVPMHYLTRKL